MVHVRYPCLPQLDMRFNGDNHFSLSETLLNRRERATYPQPRSGVSEVKKLGKLCLPCAMFLQAKSGARKRDGYYPIGGQDGEDSAYYLHVTGFDRWVSVFPTSLYMRDAR